ncbi:MAG: hypothetical protein ACK43L_04720 [Sphingobacteriales bacterium]|jgi:hypothetical protein
MKKGLHDLLFAIWIDSQKAMIIRDEPGGVYHYELIQNELSKERFPGEKTDKTGLFGTTLNNESHDQNRENEHLKKFIKQVANNIRYANTIYIMGPGDTRHLLQNELEGHKDLEKIIIQNSPAEKMDKDAFERKARSLFSVA